jgi:5'-3' exonuclease
MIGEFFSDNLAYMEGLVWTLNYYYHGHLSWSWYYPFHVSPLASGISDSSFDLSLDFAKLDTKTFKLPAFEMNKPFTPLQQLLAVLPPSSASLLPKSFQDLMLKDDSPLKQFFPDPGT